jgi:DMSO reductase anchor subunit
VSERLVFFVVLGACVCGALIAVGVLEYLVWLAEQQERGT